MFMKTRRIAQNISHALGSRSLDKHNHHEAKLISSLEIEKKGQVNHVSSIKYLCTFRSPFCVCLKFMHSISGQVLLHFETYTLAGILAFTPIWVKKIMFTSWFEPPVIYKMIFHVVSIVSVKAYLRHFWSFSVLRACQYLRKACSIFR